MVKDYEFRPIYSTERVNEALGFIAASSVELSEAAIGRPLVIDTLTIFAQSTREHVFIRRNIHRFGKESPLTHGATTYISSNIKVAGFQIKFVGVREPDFTRPEVGYADYPVSNEDFEAIIAEGYQGVKEVISGLGEQLIEIRQKNFDVRGYIVRAPHDDGVERGPLITI